jgi:hypothetical protein
MQQFRAGFNVPRSDGQTEKQNVQLVLLQKLVSGLVIVPFENFKFRAEARRELGSETGIVINDGNFRAFVRLRDGPLQRGMLVIQKLQA